MICIAIAVVADIPLNQFDRDAPNLPKVQYQLDVQQACV